MYIPIRACVCGQPVRKYIQTNLCNKGSRNNVSVDDKMGLCFYQRDYLLYTILATFKNIFMDTYFERNQG